MLLKAHVRFLGGRIAAMRYGYPTRTIARSSGAPDPRSGSRIFVAPASCLVASRWRTMIAKGQMEDNDAQRTPTEQFYSLSA